MADHDLSGTPSDVDDPVLLIATCGGHRCAALHRLRRGDDGVDRAELREAVGHQPRAVLLTTGCLGRCHDGGVAAVGWATGGREGLRWREQPVAVTEIHLVDRARALAQWVCGAAPRVDRLPRRLRPRGG